MKSLPSSEADCSTVAADSRLEGKVERTWKPHWNYETKMNTDLKVLTFGDSKSAKFPLPSKYRSKNTSAISPSQQINQLLKANTFKKVILIQLEKLLKPEKNIPELNRPLPYLPSGFAYNLKNALRLADSWICGLIGNSSVINFTLPIFNQTC